MSDKIKIIDINVIYQDLVNLKDLYKFIKEWLAENDYIDKESEKSMEILYSEQAKPGNAKEYHIWWRTAKVPEGSTYYRWLLNVDYLGLFIQDREVMINDKKLKMQTGEITVFITATMELDYENKWENHWLLKHLHWLFKKRIFAKEIDAQETELVLQAYDLQSKVKSFLELKQMGGEPMKFHPTKAYEKPE